MPWLGCARATAPWSAAVSTTLWELFPATGGFNHGWSCGPLGLLDEEVAGITPTSPGFATFDVRPVLGTTLARADANVPSPYGLISILASRNVNNNRLSVRVPPGSTGRTFQPGSAGLLSGAILAVAGGATATLDETLATPEINIADGEATLLSTNGGMGAVAKNGSGNLLLGAGSALSLGAFEILQGETIVSTGAQLVATAGVATNGTGQVCDGHLTIWPGAVLSIQGGTVSCASLTNLGVCECLGGSLSITGNATNGGTLRLLGNAQLHMGGSFSNSGVLEYHDLERHPPARLRQSGRAPRPERYQGDVVRGRGRGLHCNDYGLHWPQLPTAVFKRLASGGVDQCRERSGRKPGASGFHPCQRHGRRPEVLPRGGRFASRCQLGAAS